MDWKISRLRWKKRQFLICRVIHIEDDFVKNFVIYKKKLIDFDFCWSDPNWISVHFEETFFFRENGFEGFQFKVRKKKIIKTLEWHIWSIAFKKTRKRQNCWDPRVSDRKVSKRRKNIFKEIFRPAETKRTHENIFLEVYQF